MPFYESVFIARQDISAQQVEALAENFQTVIKDNGGEVTKQENWGIKSLAYKIKKNRKGHYVLFNIDAPSGAISEMERQMRINEDILRYLTLKVDELEEGESIQMQNRSSRDERRPRRDYNDQGNSGSSENKGADAAPEVAPEAAPEVKTEAAPEAEAPEEAAPVEKTDESAEVESAPEGEEK